MRINQRKFTWANLLCRTVHKYEWAVVELNSPTHCVCMRHHQRNTSICVSCQCCAIPRDRYKFFVAIVQLLYCKRIYKENLRIATITKMLLEHFATRSLRDASERLQGKDTSTFVNSSHCFIMPSFAQIIAHPRTLISLYFQTALSLRRVCTYVCVYAPISLSVHEFNSLKLTRVRKLVFLGTNGYLHWSAHEMSNLNWNIFCAVEAVKVWKYCSKYFTL